jgi:hypothetical protein
MAEKKKAATASSKKDARHQVEKKLENALGYLLPELGEKKFKRRMKEAGKLIMHGIGSPKVKPTASIVKKAASKAPTKKAEKPDKKKAKK